MKDKYFFSIICGAVALVGLAGYLLLVKKVTPPQNLQVMPPPTTTSSPTPPTSQPSYKELLATTSTWPVYINKEFDYQISYPPGGQIHSIAPDNSYGQVTFENVLAMPKQFGYMYIWARKTGDATATLSFPGVIDSWRSKGKIVTEGEKLVAGKSVHYIEFGDLHTHAVYGDHIDDEWSGVHTFVIQFKEGRFRYTIAGTKFVSEVRSVFGAVEKLDAKQYEQIFNEMLNSFAQST